MYSTASVNFSSSAKSNLASEPSNEPATYVPVNDSSPAVTVIVLPTKSSSVTSVVSGNVTDTCVALFA
ncbi:hypothetical protein [Metalysinibacillus jejuensis]|uniref:hypothetical protein n=1 Tax=Metalysinibacillus jejuensis TaxID=914327 RepID=UPI0012904356|nr:hypothetical protein [Metalysinibacillus jejuensis]